MVVIRPITLDDLPAVEALSELTGFGLTTLPRDIQLLRRRIRDSIRGFDNLADQNPPRGETYLFVLEDLENHKVVGTCGIISKAGGFEPFYAYQVESEFVESKQLNVRKEIRTLHLVENHDGPCEIGSLFLTPEYRREGNGRLLSLSRFLFMADHKEYFDPMVIAEMRGVVDDRGSSPFWDAVGKHFFEIDFPSADYLSMVNKKFIADLMPRHPIYIPLLPEDAQSVIAQVHSDTRPALKLLEDEGFRRCGMVDIFEAGPVVRCALEEIRSISQSGIAGVEELTEEADGTMMLVANCRRDFRATLAMIQMMPGGTVRISKTAAAALNVKPLDIVRFIRSRAAHHGGTTEDAPSSI